MVVPFSRKSVVSSQAGLDTGTVSGGSEASPGEVTFEMVAVEGPNTTRILVNGEQQDVEDSTPDVCDPPTGSLTITRLELWDTDTDTKVRDLADSCLVYLTLLVSAKLSQGHLYIDNSAL